MPVTRRGFLGVGAAAAALAGLPAAAAPPAAAGSGRAARAFWLREQAAREDLAAAAMPERDNGDEERYADRIGSFSKGLPHNALGEVDHEAYRALQRGLESVRESALERVPLGGTQKLVNPLAGVAFDLEGIDIQKLAVPSALALASAERAREMIELYWMALCRDVPFS